MSKIIGLVGFANSGKTTLANAIFAAAPVVTKINFAEPLYEMMMVLGVTREQIDDKELREVPLYILGGKSPVECLISLGTGWGREMVYNNIWCDIARARARSSSGIVIFENIRFQNELDMVREEGGALYYISNPYIVVGNGRVSEQHIDSLRRQCDRDLYNDPNVTDIGDLADTVLSLI